MYKPVVSDYRRRAGHVNAVLWPEQYARNGHSIRGGQEIATSLIAWTLAAQREKCTFLDISKVATSSEINNHELRDCRAVIIESFASKDHVSRLFVYKI